MTGGPPSDAERAWTHPSELGMATRGSSDRRRSSVIATGVLIGGLGLLLSGWALGTTQDEGDEVSSGPRPVERIEQSLATVVVERDGRRSTASGLVVDGEGHVVVAASALEGAQVVEVRCDGAHRSGATTVASDEESDVAVLRVDEPVGAPIAVAAHAAAAQGRVVLARATEEGTDTTAALIEDGLRLVEDAGREAQAVFDRSGRLLGMSGGDGHVTPASEVLGTARELIDSAG